MNINEKQLRQVMSITKKNKEEVIKDFNLYCDLSDLKPDDLKSWEIYYFETMDFY